MTSILFFLNGRRPKKKMEKNEDIQKKNGKRPKKKWKTNQSTKMNLIGCDTIVNSPSQTVNNNKIP